MISVFKSTKSEWGIINSSLMRVLYIGLGKYILAFDYGKKYRQSIHKKYIELKDEQFNKNCEVCGKPLNVTSWRQVIRFHPECRKLRKKNVK